MSIVRALPSVFTGIATLGSRLPGGGASSRVGGTVVEPVKALELLPPPSPERKPAAQQAAEDANLASEAPGTELRVYEAVPDRRRDKRRKEDRSTEPVTITLDDSSSDEASQAYRRRVAVSYGFDQATGKRVNLRI